MAHVSAMVLKSLPIPQRTSLLLFLSNLQSPDPSRWGCKINDPGPGQVVGRQLQIFLVPCVLLRGLRFSLNCLRRSMVAS